MFIGMIDLRKGLMEFCNCGHNAPILDGKYKKTAKSFFVSDKFSIFAAEI
jgi:serine phosphatase RsbU (regulator of sigma subunit)